MFIKLRSAVGSASVSKSEGREFEPYREQIFKNYLNVIIFAVRLVGNLCPS
jgi:hypothetical protein